jgi:hypothetical protein
MKKEFTENSKNIFITIFISLFIALILIILEAINNSESIININNSLNIYFYIGLLILGSGIAGFSFPAFRKTEKAISYLILPASSIEKYLSFIILSSFGFLAVFTAIFFTFDIIVTFIYSFFQNENIKYLSFSKSVFFNIIVIYFNLNALFLLGAVTFKKTPPFFTILFSLLAILGLFLFFSFITSNYATNTISLFTNTVSEYYPERNVLIISDNMLPVKILKYLGLFGLVLFFWLIGYLKLKEKEV